MPRIFLSLAILACASCAAARYALSNVHSTQLQAFFGASPRNPAACRAGGKTYVLTADDTTWYLQSGSQVGAAPVWSYSGTYYPSSALTCVDPGDLSPSSRPAIFVLKSNGELDVSGDFFVGTQFVPGSGNPSGHEGECAAAGSFAQIDWGSNSSSDWYPNLNGVVLLYSCGNTTGVLFYSLYDAVNGNAPLLLYARSSAAGGPVGIDAGAFPAAGRCAAAFALGRRIVLATAGAAVEGANFAYAANWGEPLEYQSPNDVTSVALLSLDQVAYTDCSPAGDVSVYVVNMTSGTASRIYTRSGGGRCLVLAGDLLLPELDAAGRDLLVFSGSALLHFACQAGQWAFTTLPLDFGSYNASIVLSRGQFAQYTHMNLVSLVRMSSEATLSYYYGYELACSDYSGDSGTCSAYHCTYCAEEGLCTEGGCPNCQALANETACLASLCHWCGEVARCTGPSSPCERCRHLASCAPPCVTCNSSGLCFSRGDVCTYCPEYTTEPTLCRSSSACAFCGASGECLARGERCFDCRQYADLYGCGYDSSCGWCSYLQTCESIHSDLLSPLSSSLCRCGDADDPGLCRASPYCYWREEDQSCITLKCAKGELAPADFVSTITDTVEGHSPAGAMDYFGNIYAVVQIATGPYFLKVDPTPQYVCKNTFGSPKTLARAMIYDPAFDLIYVVGGGIDLPVKVDYSPADVGFAASLKTRDCFVAALTPADCSVYWAVPWGSAAEGETFTDIALDGDYIAISGVVGPAFPLNGACDPPPQVTGLMGIVLIYDRAWSLVSCQFCGAQLNKLSTMDGNLAAVGVGQFQDWLVILRYFSDSRTWLCDYVVTDDPIINSTAVVVFKDTTGDYLVAMLPAVNAAGGGPTTRLFVAQFFAQRETLALRTDVLGNDTGFRLIVTAAQSIYSYLLTFDLVGYIYNGTVAHPFMGTITLGYAALNQTTTRMNVHRWRYVVMAPHCGGDTRYGAVTNLFNLVLMAGYTTQSDYYETTQQPHSPGAVPNPIGTVVRREDMDVLCLPRFPVAPLWTRATPLKPVGAGGGPDDVLWPTFNFTWDAAFFGYANGTYRFRAGSSIDLTFAWGYRYVLNQTAFQGVPFYDERAKESETIDVPFSFEATNITWSIEPHTPYSYSTATSWFVYRVVPVAWPADMVRHAALGGNGMNVSSSPGGGTEGEELHYGDGQLMIVTAHADAYVRWSTTAEVFNLTGQRWLVFSASVRRDAGGSSGFSWLPGYPKVRIETYDGYVEYSTNSTICLQRQAGPWAQFGVPLSREQPGASACAWAVVSAKGGDLGGLPDLRGVTSLSLRFAANAAIVQLNLTDVSLAAAFAPVYASSESSAPGSGGWALLGLLAPAAGAVILLAVLIVLVYRRGRARREDLTAVPLYSVELQVKSDFQAKGARFVADAKQFPLWVPSKPLYFGHPGSLAPIDTRLAQTIYIANGPWKGTADGFPAKDERADGKTGSRRKRGAEAQSGSGGGTSATPAGTSSGGNTASGTASGTACGAAGRRGEKSDSETTGSEPRLGLTSSRYSWKIYPPRQAKYTLEVTPDSGTLGVGKQAEVTLALFVRCTTNLSLEIPIAVCKGGEYSEDAKQYYTYLRVQLSTVISTKLDPEEIEIPDKARPIGSGSYGNVFAGRFRGQEVAVKIMKDQQPNGEDMAAFVAEATVMESLVHPCILRFIGACHIPGRLALVTELCALGTLKSFCERERGAGRKVGCLLKLKCLLDCARAMTFIHRNNIMHRDLKLANLLMVSADHAADVCCKVADMGTTRTINKQNQTQQYTKAVGTPTHMAPEVIDGQAYSPLADVYSFAVLAYELMTEIAPYSCPCVVDGKAYDFQGTYRPTEFVMTGKRLPIPASVPPNVARLITECWKPEHCQRPPFSEVSRLLEQIFAEARGSAEGNSAAGSGPSPPHHHRHRRHHQREAEKEAQGSEEEV
jgi:hypothetical protein